MADLLDGAGRKLDRAKEHLTVFNHESTTWLAQENFCRLEFEDHGDERWYVLESLAVPPPRLSAILGDCVQNLRSSLDYLAWALVLANKCAPGDWTYFPIYRKWKAGAKFSPKCVTGMNPRAVAIIEKLQPYYGGKNPDTDLLWFIRELSNTDKHRELTIVLNQAVVTEFRIYAEFPDGIKTFAPTWRESGMLRHGAKVAMFKSGTLKGGTYMKVQADAKSFITLGQAFPWGAQPIADLIEAAWEFVSEDVFPRFLCFFP